MSGTPCYRGYRASLLPARPRAQSLGGPHAALVIEPALARPRRGPARLARLGGDEGAADELDQALLRIAAVPLLRAVAARDDQDRALRGEPSTAQGAQPCLDATRERRTALEIEAQLRRGGHLVDVLAAGTGGAHERERQLAVRNLDAVGDAQRQERSSSGADFSLPPGRYHPHPACPPGPPPAPGAT